MFEGQYQIPKGIIKVGYCFEKHTGVHENFVSQVDIRWYGMKRKYLDNKKISDTTYDIM